MKTRIFNMLVVAVIVLQPIVCFGEPISIYELQKKGDVYFYQNRPYNGEFEEYDEHEGSHSIGNMKNGKIHGEWKYFDENGNLINVENYKDGKLHGESFHYNGKLSSVGNYKDGKLHGEWKSFHYNGKLSSVGNYKDGKENGEWKYFDKNGKLREIRNYKNGDQQREKRSFDRNGNLINILSNTPIPSVFIDSRDGKQYKYIKIGSQTWMAENLNYATKSGSLCNENKAVNCTKYGRLYDYETAVKSCPSGWHLPSYDEWEKLIDFAGGISKLAGTKLKAKSGWNSQGKSGNGTDEFGFSALPGGLGYDGNYFDESARVGLSGNWWFSNSASDTYYFTYFTMNNSEGIYANHMWDDCDGGSCGSILLFSVRCVQNKCGNKLYDSETHFCHTDKIYDKCGDKTYDPETQFCHTDKKVYTKCGDLEYYPEMQFCHTDNEIYIKCDKPYNPETQFCHTDNNVYDKCGGTLAYNPGTEQCCGNSRYTLSTHFCHTDNEIYPKCGDKTYNPNVQSCHTDNKVYIKCGDKTYKSETQFCNYTDSRDGKTYKVTKIGLQTWMVENLNYDANGSKCYGNKDCTKYGRLYNWSTALKACPSGWHLPSKSEYEMLDKAVGGENVAGKKLKAKSCWSNNGNGTDDYGFSALPGGNGSPGGSFNNVGNFGYWWSATEYDSNRTYHRYMGYDSGTHWDYLGKSYLHSVRCVQD